MSDGIVARPDGDDDIERLRAEVDRLDAEILQAIERRTEICHSIARFRLSSGAPRFVHSSDVRVLARYGELGPEGRSVGMILLRLARGRFGRAT